MVLDSTITINSDKTYNIDKIDVNDYAHNKIFNTNKIGILFDQSIKKQNDMVDKLIKNCLKNKKAKDNN